MHTYIIPNDSIDHLEGTHFPLGIDVHMYAERRYLTTSTGLGIFALSHAT